MEEKQQCEYIDYTSWIIMSGTAFIIVGLAVVLWGVFPLIEGMTGDTLIIIAITFVVIAVGKIVPRRLARTRGVATIHENYVELKVKAKTTQIPYEKINDVYMKRVVGEYEACAIVMKKGSPKVIFGAYPSGEEATELNKLQLSLKDKVKDSAKVVKL